MQKDMLFWIWLSEALGAASRDFRALISMYENPYEIFHIEDEELECITGISERTRKVLANKDLQRATQILDECERLGIGVLPFSDARYPNALRELKDPPVLLYYKGSIPDLNRLLSIGMVGTRRMSAYGMQSAYQIAYELASVGAVVVSGMAAGIDGVCAAAALAANGVTVAVLGCGLDVVYPRHHKPLMEEIERHGVIFSEYPPGTRPNHYHFPIRNRLISGLSQGTVVVEAGLGSGSLITAKNAILQGRDVFALPANVGSHGAEGSNGLLQDGANLVLGTADILKPYRYVYAGVLDTEVLEQAKRSSKADLAYLDRMGVIELTRPTRDVPPPVCAAEETSPKQKKKTVRKTPPQNRVDATEAAKTPSPSKQTPDEVLSSLTPVQLAVLEAIPDDRAVTVDSLGGTGYSFGDIIAALTMLEILGLVQKLPGALYTKS